MSVYTDITEEEPLDDVAFLRDLSDRLFNVPPMYDVDQGDSDRLQDIADLNSRLRAALLHIATGGISPSIGFAQRVLLGHSVADAHEAERALMFDERGPVCKRCRDIGKVIDYALRDEPRFYDCPACSKASADV